MTAPQTDNLLRQYFVDAAVDGPPPDLLARSLSRTVVARQKRVWWEGVRRSLPRLGLSARTARLAYVGIVMVALLAGFVLGGLSGTPKESPGPTNSASPSTGLHDQGFTRPFTWQSMDPASPHRVLRYQGLMDPEVFHWLDAAAAAHPGERNGSQAAGSYGIAMGSGLQAQPDCTDPEQEQVFLRRAPANLLWDLRNVGGAGLGPERAATLDGRPALMADLDPERNLACAKKLRLNQWLGASEVLLLTLPSRFIVAEVDGETIIVQIWARTAADLSLWLPEAMQFVDGIHFDPVPGWPPESPLTTLVRIDGFRVPFDYTPIAGGEIGPTRNIDRLEVYHWVHDPSGVDAHDGRNLAQTFGEYGVAIASTGRATIEHCRIVDGTPHVLPMDPADFLGDLRAIAAAGLEAPKPTTLDGWPAFVADLDPAGNVAGCPNELRLNPVLDGGDYLALNLPSRFIVAKVDSEIVIVQIWARTSERLYEWLPAASRFVEDIHFLDRG